jgi:inositol-phosphate transport system permease protein
VSARPRTQAFLLIGLALLALPVLVPYLWLVLSSFGDGRELVFGFVPRSFTLHNWRFLWDATAAGRDMPPIGAVTGNTVLLATSVMVLEVVLATNVGYVLSKYTFRGRSSVLAFTTVLHAFPSITLLVSLFIVLRALGLLDSLWGVVMVKVALQLPFSVFVMKGFFDGVPHETEMSALVDGCTRLGAYARVILPQVKPGIFAIAVFSFVEGWKEFLFVIAFTFDKSRWTLSAYLASILGEGRGVDYGLLSAVAVFYMLPVAAFFAVSQRYLMKVELGGVKG